MAPLEEKPLPDFKQPPIAEVVCSIAFESLDAMLAPHLGLYWDIVRAEYSKCEEKPLLTTIIEKAAETPKATVQVTMLPPLPRTWLVSGDNQKLIQVQRDRFVHNWRKLEPDDPYPRYPKVMAMFLNGLDSFGAFLKENQLGEIVPIQYELTYVNYIPSGEGWTTLADIGEVLPDFAWRDKQDRFLPTPESNNWNTAFLLPNDLGRLRATVQKAIRHTADQKQDVIRFDLTARGIGADKSRDAMDAWFELAHEWIVRGFADLTGDKVQHKYWGRF